MKTDSTQFPRGAAQRAHEPDGQPRRPENIGKPFSLAAKARVLCVGWSVWSKREDRRGSISSVWQCAVVRATAALRHSDEQP